jgi:hypothetical protein
MHFDGRIPNYHFSQTEVLNYQKPSNKGIPSTLDVKSCQNFQNSIVFIFLNFFIKFFKDSGISIFENSVKF